MRILFILALAACGSSSAPASKEAKLCRQAADRYEQCLGADAAKEVQRLADGPACSDEKAQAAFRECLPKETCDEFIGCVVDHAMR